MNFIHTAALNRSRVAVAYRPDIDGLRAIAILSVAFYHFGLGPVTGGFVGVDIFFVISGYLITSIVTNDINSGRFSFVNFYKRRIRRLLPAYFLVAFTSLIVGYYLLLPKEFELFSWQIIYASFGAANFFFLWHTGGYFDAPSSMMPMLHMWSLAVEEQFYLVWPALLLVAMKFQGKFSKLTVVLLGILTVASFFASVVVTTSNQPVAFFMLHTRAWELATGGILAFVPAITAKFVAELCRLIGILLILAAIIFIKSDQNFPGHLALAPVLGTSLIIWPSKCTTFIARLLSTRPMVACGLISYSLYLWHWPIACFARHASLTESFDQVTGVGLLALSVALAAVTYRFVGLPFRRGLNLSTRQVFIGAGAVASLLVSLSSIVIVLSGIPSRLDPNVLSLSRGSGDYSRNRSRCHRNEKVQMPIKESCVFGSSAPPRLAIWADSHGMELADAIGERLEEKNASILSLTASACPPALQFQIPARPECIKYNDDVLKYLVSNNSIDRVIITAFYSFYESYGSDEFYSGLQSAVKLLVSAGKTVTIVGPTPVSHYRVPQRAAKMRLISSEALNLPISDYSQEMGRALKEISLLAKLPEVEYVSAAINFCDKEKCYLTDDRGSYYFDDHHLSMYGARKIAEAIISP